MTSSNSLRNQFNLGGSNLSSGEALEIAQVLQAAKKSVLPYDGDYQADWLLTDDIFALTWETTRRGRGKVVNGKGIDTDRLEWNQLLPNGLTLGNSRYDILRQTLQKASFLLRSGWITDEPVGNRHWKSVTLTYINLAKFVVLHETRYKPEKYALNLLDQDGLNYFVTQYAQGGIPLVLKVPQRILSYFYLSTYAKPCPESLYETLFELDPVICSDIHEWAKTVEGLTYTIKSGFFFSGERTFSDSMISKIANCDQEVLGTQKMRAFIRQFELNLHKNGLFIPKTLSTKYPSHKAIEFDDALKTTVTKDAIFSVTNHIKLLMSTHRHMPLECPNPEYLSIGKARSLTANQLSESKRTPMMPIDIGLHYLNGALDMLHHYGDLVITLYLSFLNLIKPTVELESLSEHKRWEYNQRAFSKLIKKPEFKVLRSNFSIVQFKTISAAKHSPKQLDALQLISYVVASCVVVICILKTSRTEELTELRRDCLMHKKGEGYYIRTSLGKSNIGEEYENTDKPIPYITARAIKLMQRLGSGIDKIMGVDTSDRLFVNMDKSLSNISSAKPGLINRKLDIFGDFLEIRLDSKGRRWYIRIHEMRRFFLLLFFWHGRFNVLEAAREIAGHTDVDHIYRYIELNFPRESFTEIEADYAIDCLRFIDRYSDFEKQDNTGIEQLRNMVCDHFNVDSLELIHDTEWESYVRDLRDDDAFYLKPHSIKTNAEGAATHILIAFIISEVGHDEK